MMDSHLLILLELNMSMKWPFFSSLVAVIFYPCSNSPH